MKRWSSAHRSLRHGTARLMSTPCAWRAILMRSPKAEMAPCAQQEPQYWWRRVGAPGRSARGGGVGWWLRFFVQKNGGETVVDAQDHYLWWHVIIQGWTTITMFFFKSTLMAATVRQQTPVAFLGRLCFECFPSNILRAFALVHYCIVAGWQDSTWSILDWIAGFQAQESWFPIIDPPLTINRFSFTINQPSTRASLLKNINYQPININTIKP